MSQVVVYVNVDTTPSNVNDAVLGNSGTLPTITGTRKVALVYDPAVISPGQLPKAVGLLCDFVGPSHCNSANAPGSTYSPGGDPV